MAQVLAYGLTYINLTPHPVTLYAEDGTRIMEFPTSGSVARLAEEAKTIDGERLPMTRVRLGEVVGLPDRTTGTRYIVSMPLLMGMAAAGIDRPDCVYPFGQVRDDAGRIIGCRSLAMIDNGRSPEVGAYAHDPRIRVRTDGSIVVGNATIVRVDDGSYAVVTTYGASKDPFDTVEAAIARVIGPPKP